MKTIEYKGYQVTTQLSDETTHVIVDEMIKQRLLMHDSKEMPIEIKTVYLTISIVFSLNCLAINIIED